MAKPVVVASVPTHCQVAAAKAGEQGADYSRYSPFLAVAVEDQAIAS